MDREGLSKIRRADILSRLAALDQQVEAQAARAKHVRDMGWNAKLSDERLKTLRESRQLYVSALKHLLGEDVVDGDAGDGSSDPPPAS